MDCQATPPAKNTHKSQKCSASRIAHSVQSHPPNLWQTLPLRGERCVTSVVEQCQEIDICLVFSKLQRLHTSVVGEKEVKSFGNEFATYLFFSNDRPTDGITGCICHC